MKGKLYIIAAIPIILFGCSKENLQCEILTEKFTNPLIIRLANLGKNPYKYSLFQSKHVTMPPMPNVRIEIKNKSTNMVKSYTPIVLSEKRKTMYLEGSGTVKLLIYHRGLKLKHGDYEVTISFYHDNDVHQRTPIVTSKPLSVTLPLE